MNLYRCIVEDSIIGKIRNVVVFEKKDGIFFASGGDDTIVRVWDTLTGTVSETLEGHTDQITVFAVTPNSRFLATGSRDRIIKIWDVSALFDKTEGN